MIEKPLADWRREADAFGHDRANRADMGGHVVDGQIGVAELAGGRIGHDVRGAPASHQREDVLAVDLAARAHA